MARSIWKGPFVDAYVLRKAEKAREAGKSDVIKIWSRRSTILPQFVGLTFGVYNGHKHIPVKPEFPAEILGWPIPVAIGVPVMLVVLYLIFLSS